MAIRDWFTSQQHRAATDLGSVLLTLGLVTKPQLEDAVRQQLEQAQQAKDQRLGEILVDMGALTPDTLHEALDAQKRMRRGGATAVMAQVVERRWDVIHGALEASARKA